MTDGPAAAGADAPDEPGAGGRPRQARVPLLWRVGLYSYRQTIGAICIVLGSLAVAWLVVHFFGLYLIERELDRYNFQERDQIVAAVHAGFLSVAIRSVLAAGCAAIVAAVFFTWLMSRSVTGAVARVRQVAQRLAQGDHNVRMSGGSRLGEEFAALTQSFNTMAEELGDIEATRARLLGDLAHEMRTPLATLDAYLEAIGDGFEEPNAETLALLRQQTARLTRLAADISLVARVEEGHFDLKRRPVCVADLVRQACQGIQTQYQDRGVELTWELEPGLEGAQVDGDPDRLGQVLTNLLSNANRHTPEGGHVVVSLTAPEPGWVAMAVRDDGEGIAAEHLPRLFERFYRVDPGQGDRGRGGSGIGLTIVRAMALAHGGSVDVASAGPGHGSTFTVKLPLLDETAEAAAEA